MPKESSRVGGESWRLCSCTLRKGPQHHRRRSTPRFLVGPGRLRKINTRAVSGYAGEIISTPLRVGKPEHPYVVPQTPSHIRHAKYRVGAFELGSFDAWLLHGSSRL